VVKATPTIAVSVSSTSVNVGDAVTIGGSISPFIEDVDVEVIVTGPAGTKVHTVKTEDGSFSLSLKLEGEGTWKIEVRVPSSAVYEEATSKEI